MSSEPTSEAAQAAALAEEIVNALIGDVRDFREELATVEAIISRHTAEQNQESAQSADKTSATESLELPSQPPSLEAIQAAAREIVPDCLSRTCFIRACHHEECWGCEDSAKERARVVAIISHHCTIDLPSADAARIAEIQQRQDGRRAETESDARYIADIDYLLSLLPAPQSGWLPIESAPKDGTTVIVALIDRGEVFRISDARFRAIGWYSINGTACPWATHWLPAPPVTEGEQK